jgi:hypothetical protein
MRLIPATACLAIVCGCNAPVPRAPPAGTDAAAYQFCGQGYPRNSQDCYVSTYGGDSASFAGTSAVAWVAGGCKLAGCEPPTTCNRDSGFCERPRCDEGLSCPNNTKCNLRSRKCE